MKSYLMKFITNSAVRTENGKRAFFSQIPLFASKQDEQKRKWKRNGEFSEQTHGAFDECIRRVLQKVSAGRENRQFSDLFQQETGYAFSHIDFFYPPCTDTDLDPRKTDRGEAPKREIRLRYSIPALAHMYILHTSRGNKIDDKIAPEKPAKINMASFKFATVHCRANDVWNLNNAPLPVSAFRKQPVKQIQKTRRFTIG